MANELMMFGDGKDNLPAHIQNAFGGDNSNITDKETVPSLGISGKVWTISVDGERTTLTKDEDGEQVSLSVLPVVILDYAKRRGRAYYPDVYVSDNPLPPTCWSNDGIAPDESVQEKQAAKCSNCPKSIKGSKTIGGREGVACSQYRMLAVVPAQRLDFVPLRLKIPITSDWDKESADPKVRQFAFQQFLDFLRANNVPNTASMVVKLRFDPIAEYPKILFTPARWLSPAEVEAVKKVQNTDAVKDLLNSTWTPAGIDGVKRIEATSQTVVESPKHAIPESVVEIPTAKPVTSAPKPVTKVAPVEDDEDSPIQGLTAPAAPPTTPKQPKAAAPKAVPKAEPAELPSSIASLLGEWGDETE